MSGTGSSTGQEQQNRLKILEDLQQQKKRLQLQTSTSSTQGAQLPAQARTKEGPSVPTRGPADARNLDQRQKQALQMTTTMTPTPCGVEGAAELPAAVDADEHHDEEVVIDDPDKERQKARDFDCGCQTYNNGPCIHQFTEDEIVNVRMDMRELTEAEKDLILLGIFHTSMNRSEKIRFKGRKELKDRTRTRTSYTIHSKRVCNTAFRYLHAISKNKSSAVAKWYREHGLTPRKKKSGGRVESKRTLKFEDTSRIVQFIKTFAEEHSLAFPGRDRNSKKGERLVLPSTYTKAGIWRNHYKPAMHMSGFRAAERSTFTKLWHQLCPHIIFKKTTPKEKTPQKEKKTPPAVLHHSRFAAAATGLQHCPDLMPGHGHICNREAEESVMVVQSLLSQAQGLYRSPQT